MKRTYFKWSALAVMLVAGLEGCYDFSKFDNISIDPISPKLVVPVVNSTISFKELAEREDANTIVVQKPGDTKFYLVYRDTIDVGAAASEFTIPAVAISKTFQLDAGEIPAAPMDITVNKDFSETYTPITGSEIKSILLTQGTLNLYIDNHFNKDIVVNIEITSIKKPQGQSEKLTIPVGTAGSSNTSIDLTNNTIFLFDGVNYNTFFFTAEITIKDNGQPIAAGDYAGIQISLNNLDFSYIVGKINQNIGVPDHDYKVDIFRSTYIADQHLEEPRLSFNFINGYGVPFAFNINSFEASNTTSNEVVYLANEGTPDANTLRIGTPNSINYVQTIGGDPATDSLALNKNNSNIEDIFDIAPNQFKLRAGITLGDGSDNHDYFVDKNATLKILSDIEIPLIGWVETNQINDTIVDIELPDLEEDLNLNENDSLKITLKFKFNNNIPLNMYFQAYFLNDMNQELTKLFEDELWLVKSATVSPTTGRATSPTQDYAEIIVNRSKYSLMKDATKIVLQVRFKTGGETHQSVVIESTNYIDIQMSVIAEGTVNFD